MASVVLDTSILVWGVRKESPHDDRADLVERCTKLIKRHQDDGDSIVVPSIVAAEYLIGCSATTREAQRTQLFENFFIAPFDSRAAEIAADLYDRQLLANVTKETGAHRQCLKADFKVIATAIAHSAGSIYTSDKHMSAFANGRIQVLPVPSLAELSQHPQSTGESHQTSLFDAP
jgi:predicted nucleic acid-binding protein